MLVIAANVTQIHRREGQVEVDATPCTSADFRICQHIALSHLSDAIGAYPQSQQYTVRWYGSWLQRFIIHDEGFEIIYNHQQHDLTENAVGVNAATMDYCDHVTDKAIHSVAASSGGFASLSKNYKPL